MTTRIVGVLLVSALIACRRDKPRQADPSGAALSLAAAPQDTAFAGTTAPIHRARPIQPGVPPALLRAVETSSGPGYDRVVFEFAGDSVPGYHVAYMTAPVRRCGSGHPAPVARPSPFDSVFAAAGAEFHVPPALLAGVGWAETRWQMVQGAEEFPGRPAAFGVMALRGAALERGASLAGVTPEEARRDAVANIRAAAAVLDAYASEAGAARERIEQWSAVIARYGEIGIPAAQAAYLGQVDRGVALAGARPGLAIGSAAQAACPSPDTAALDYPQAIWRPSPNFDQRPTDATGALHMVIIHTCESNYAGCWSWLVNSVSQASAHYVVDEDGAEVSQLVRERDRAWHIAALYDCTLNRHHDCWRNDVQSNDFTVGIEHAGFASQASFPAAQLDRSAALVCDVTRDRGIPRDWQHIVGHGQLQPANRTDPGPNWPWIAYLHRVPAWCGEVIVDDSAQFNDAAVATVSVPA